MRSITEETGGSFSWPLYREYFRNGGGFLTWFGIVSLFLILQGSDIWGAWWLGHWAEALEDDPDTDSRPFMLVYGLSVLAAGVVICLRSFLVVAVGIKVSQSLHSGMLDSILK